MLSDELLAQLQASQPDPYDPAVRTPVIFALVMSPGLIELGISNTHAALLLSPMQ